MRIKYFKFLNTDNFILLTKIFIENSVNVLSYSKDNNSDEILKNEPISIIARQTCHEIKMINYTPM